MSATCVGIRAPLTLRARAKGGVKGSRTVRVLAKASAAEDVKGCKVGLARSRYVSPPCHPRMHRPLIQRRSALVSNHLV